MFVTFSGLWRLFTFSSSIPKCHLIKISRNVLIVISFKYFSATWIDLKVRQVENLSLLDISVCHSSWKRSTTFQVSFAIPSGVAGGSNPTRQFTTTFLKGPVGQRETRSVGRTPCPTTAMSSGEAAPSHTSWRKIGLSVLQPTLFTDSSNIPI